MSTFFHRVCGCVCLATTLVTLDALLMPGAVTQASVINVTNASFQDDTAPSDPGYSWNTPTGWTKVGGTAGYYKGGTGYAVNGAAGNTSFSNATGSQLGWIHANDYGAPENGGLVLGSIYQSVGTIAANTSYNLQVDLGRISGNTGLSGDAITVALCSTNLGGNVSTIAQSVATYGTTGTSALTTFTADTGALNANLVGSNLSIRIYASALGGMGTDRGSVIWAADNVSLTSAAAANTPEPGTLVLLGTGLMGLLAYAWRKRK